MIDVRLISIPKGEDEVYEALVIYNPSADEEKIDKLRDLMFHDLGWWSTKGHAWLEFELDEKDEYTTFINAFKECLVKVEKEGKA